MKKKTLDLTGRWQFKEYPIDARRMRDLNGSGWLNCTIPNSVFTNLIEAGNIDRFDIDANPENYTWVSDKPWVYRKTFDVSEELRKADKLELVCDGLDTLASVWLNEKLIGRTENMFIEHRFDITKRVKATDNSLVIKFDPVVPHATKMMERYTPFSESMFTNPFRAYVRKAQYQFGWDWCPPFPGCGIWRPLRLESTIKARIKNLHIRTINCDEKNADVRIAVDLDRTVREKFQCSLDIYDNKMKKVRHLEFEPHGDSGSAIVNIENPRMWFPAGYGEAVLYQVHVNLLAGGKIIDTVQSSFGIRTVKLNQPKDKSGSGFVFEINNRKIYAKGADWIPASVFAGSVKNEDYENLVTAAADANMNMLRVWGGGYYEDDRFYELCDKLGIMVWQDFMFACCYYPDRQWFLDAIADEARSVIRRLHNHPCLVIYCGNNEIDWIHHMNTCGAGKRMHGKKIWHKLLPKIVGELEPDMPYIPTTPFSPTKDPNESDSGTIHNWDVWSRHQPVNTYITKTEEIPRFVTEFGFQSPANLETIKSCCPPEQLRPSSAAVEKHNYQIDGCGRLYRYLGDIFGQVGDIEQFVYLSQLVQARAVKTYVEFLRAQSNINSGVLFWQLNDSYPAITWSAIDYAKKPKALYYYARRFFAPQTLTVVPHFEHLKAGYRPKIEGLSIVAVNDTANPVTTNLVCTLCDFRGNQVDTIDMPLTVSPFSSSRPLHLPKALALPEKPEQNALHLKMQTNNDVPVENIYFYLPDKYIDWTEPNITQQLIQVEGNKALLVLNSDNIAKDIKIESEHILELSDNFFDLLPGKERQIELRLSDSIQEADIQIKLTNVASVICGSY